MAEIHRRRGGKHGSAEAARAGGRPDPFGAVRERPVLALGLLLGAGILLGFLTGGEGEKEPIRAARGQAGAELWERRARRLRRVSREQEAELDRLRLARLPLDDPEDEGFELDEEEDDFDLDDEDEDEEEDDDFDLDEDDDDEAEDDDLGFRHDSTVAGARGRGPLLPAFIREGMQRMIRREPRSA